MRVKEILDRKHPFIYEDELATKARAVIRNFALRILPAVDENKKFLGVVSRGNIMAIASSVSLIRVGAIMATSKHIAAMEDDAASTVKEMIRLDEWYIPVVNSAQDKTYRGVLGLENFIEAPLKANLNRLSKPVSEVMSKNVVACSPDDEIDNVWRLMQSQYFAGLPVVKKNKLVGIVTQKDFLESGAMSPTFESRKGRFRASSKISTIMKTTADVSEAAKLIISKDIGRIPVKDYKGKLIDIVNREDVAKLLF